MIEIFHITESVKKNCYNWYESYGEICVHCGCCSKDPETMCRARIELHKRMLKEEENFDNWWETEEGRKAQEETIAENIKWNKAQIRKYEQKLKRIVPDCPYCKKKLGEIRDGKRWCYNCHFWINADGSKAEEEREWLK